MDNIKPLLKRISYNISLENPIESYNILSVLGVDYKEVKICRLIGDLLNPNGAHNLGIMPLKLFLAMVDGKNEMYGFNDEKLKYANIVLEDFIDNSRRVDIAIHIDNTVIPIEAKIWAGDQDNQICDYFHYYENSKTVINKIYYLTPFGKEPSDISKGDLTGEQYQEISFDETIRQWLKGIKENIEKNKVNCNKRVYSMIDQFIEVIDNMCKNEKELKEITENIPWDNSNEIKALYQVCKYSDAILILVKQRLISDCTELKSPYSYSKDIDNTDYYKSQMIYKIVKEDDENFNAWIGMDENGAYLVIKSENAPKIPGWKSDRGVYYWRRIPDNKKPLKIVDYDSTIKININEFLDEFVNI